MYGWHWTNESNGGFPYGDYGLGLMRQSYLVEDPDHLGLNGPGADDGHGGLLQAPYNNSEAAETIDNWG